MQTTVDFIITPILIGAIEATLIWNRIPNANHATTSSQLIPLFLSITLLLFVLCQLLISIGENIRPPTHNHSSSDSSNNTTEHIYAPIPSPCPCGRSGCRIDEKYSYSYPTTSSEDPSHPAATHTTGGYCLAQRYPRRTRIPPPAPTVVSTSESSSSSSDSSARTDKADSGASSSAPEPSSKGESPKKGSVEGGSKGEGSGPPSPTKGGSSSGSGGSKGPGPISGQSGSSS